MKKVCFGKRITFNQKVLITGKGLVKIGNDEIFGCKEGGYWYKNCIELQARFENSQIIIKDNCSFNNNLFLCIGGKLIIEKDCLIGHNCEFFDFDAHGVNPQNRRKNRITPADIYIGKNVWIGNNVTILKGSQIGENCVIATGAVVKGKFPSNVVLGGIPARIIKKI